MPNIQVVAPDPTQADPAAFPQGNGFELESIFLYRGREWAQLPARERKVPVRRVREFPATRKIFLLSVFLVAQGIFFNSSMFHLQNVFVVGNSRVADAEILNRAGLPMDIHLLRLDMRGAAGRVAQLHWVKTAAVRRHLPGTATIRVEERVPVLALAPCTGEAPVFPGSYFLVSGDGWVLSRAGPHHDATLKRAQVDLPLEVGKRIPAEVVGSVLTCLAELPDNLSPAITQVVADARGQVNLTMTFLGQPVEIRVGGPEKTRYKFQVLGALLGQLQAQGGPVTYIDLRYADPAVGRPAPLRPAGPPDEVTGEEQQEQ